LKFASGRGARAMAIFGEDERARGAASIRNLQTREQQTVPRDQAVAVITQLLNREPRTLEPRTENREP
jgi:histidyl-tRNA synthetase